MFSRSCKKATLVLTVVILLMAVLAVAVFLSAPSSISAVEADALEGMTSTSNTSEDTAKSEPKGPAPKAKSHSKAAAPSPGSQPKPKSKVKGKSPSPSPPPLAPSTSDTSEGTSKSKPKGPAPKVKSKLKAEAPASRSQFKPKSKAKGKGKGKGKGKTPSPPPPSPTESKCDVDFYLWNADTNVEVGRLEDHLVNGVLCLPNYQVSFEARATQSCNEESALVETHIFAFNNGMVDTLTAVENKVPYTAFGGSATDIVFGRTLVPGHYSLFAHIYAKDDNKGEWLASAETKFKTSATDDCDCKIEFYLWNADTNTEVGKLKDHLVNGVLCLPNFQVSFEARATHSCGEESALVETYMFPFNNGMVDTLTAVENKVPYTAFGGSATDIVFGRTLVPGHYSICAHIYAKDDNKGEWLASAETKFKTAAEDGCDCKVEFYLWNADTNTEVGKLKDHLVNGVLCLPNYQVSFEARPTHSCDEESALLETYMFPFNNGMVDTLTAIENKVPYTAFGGSATDIVFGRTLIPGHYSICAHIYAKDNNKGEWLASAEIKFQIETENVKLILWNADTNSAIGLIEDQLGNGVLTLPSYEVNIEARPFCLGEESAILELYEFPFNYGATDQVTTVDNSVPYTVFDMNRGRDLVPGYYGLSVHFFARDNLQGNFLLSIELKFEVREATGRRALPIASNEKNRTNET